MATIHIMKPFNLEEAKAGKPVCTRDGRKARIVCFDRKGFQPIVACIQTNGEEELALYNTKGKWLIEDTCYDLFMADGTETLPNSWEEFCENYPIKDSEFYIGEFSAIKYHESGDRLNLSDCNLLRTYKQAEAMLAFIQLIRLRDVYRQGWEPDWKTEENKYVIGNLENEAAKGAEDCYAKTLSFQSKELRDLFFDNFKDLIEKAKEFI